MIQQQRLDGPLVESVTGDAHATGGKGLPPSWFANPHHRHVQRAAAKVKDDDVLRLAGRQFVVQRGRHRLQLKGDVPETGLFGCAAQPSLGPLIVCLSAAPAKVHRPAEYHALHGLACLRFHPSPNLPQIEGDQLFQFVVTAKDRRPLVAGGQPALEGAQQPPRRELVHQHVNVSDKGHLGSGHLDLADVPAHHLAGAAHVLAVVGLYCLSPDKDLVVAGDVERRADHGRVMAGRVEGKDTHLLPVKDRRAGIGCAKVKADTHELLRATSSDICVCREKQL